MILVLVAVAVLLLAAAVGAVAALAYSRRRQRTTRAIDGVLAALQQGTPLRDALADALDDPTLAVWYRLSGSSRWVEPDGHFVPEPSPGPGRAQTTIERSGLPIAVFDYDGRLARQWDLIGAVAKAAGLSVTNERLQAELRAQYAELETVTDTAPSLLVNVSTEGRILNQNQAAVAVAGAADQEQIRGRYFWDVFIDPNERDAVIARFHASAPDFRPAEYENSFTNELGERRVVYWRSAPILSEDGIVLSIIAGGLDITDREQLLQEMERERAFLNAIANNAPSLLALVDQSGRVIDLATNIAFERTLEYEPEDTGGHVFWERYVDPAEADDVRAILERVFRGETVGEHDHHWVTSTGRRLVIAWTCTPLPRLDERTLFLISGVDVTERMEREQEVERRRAFLNAITGAVPSFLLAVDPEARFVEDATNHAFRDTFGWTEQELRGQSFVELIAHEDEDLVTTAIADAVEVAQDERESRWFDRDGGALLVAWTARPVLDSEGRRLVLVSGSDVTLRRRQEEEIRASRARIVRAEDEARRALERNLHDGAQQRLVAISVGLRLVESKLLSQPDEARALLEGTREELAQALEELRELARGIHPAVLTDRGLGPALETLAARAPIPIELDAPHERLAPAVEAAAYYVVAESLTNVVKYGQASSAEVSLSTANGTLHVTVSDDGIGGADPERGSGLRGLADRVEALEGRFDVSSPPGRGTTITAEIPLHPVRPIPG